MDQTNADQSEQTRLGQSRMEQTRSDLTRVYQDYQTRRVRTPPDQHRQKRPDRRDQEQSISTNGQDHKKPYQENQIERSRPEHKPDHHNRPNRNSHRISTRESNRFKMKCQNIDKHMKNHDEQRTRPPPDHIQEGGSNTAISPTTSPRTKKQSLKHNESEQ